MDSRPGEGLVYFRTDKAVVRETLCRKDFTVSVAPANALFGN